MLIAACQTAPNAKHDSFPVLEPAFSLVCLKKSCWSQLAKPLRMQSMARFLCWNLHFPYRFWRNHVDRRSPNSSECEACLVSCFETCMFPPLRMRSMARFLFWNLHFPLCFWRNHADRSLPNCSECKALLVSCFETCIVPSVFEETMLIAACHAAPNAKHS